MDTNQTAAPYPIGLWPQIDPSLLGETRSIPPVFPLALVPDRWRAWIEAPAHSFIPVDYLMQGMLGAVAGVCGAGTLVYVNDHWSEPLVLWQALVGGPSAGKSATFARIRPLLEAVEPPKDSGDRAASAILSDGAMNQLSIALGRSSRGVVIWRDDLAGWMAEARNRLERPRWLAAWNAGEAIPRSNIMPPSTRQYLAATILGGLRPEQLAEGLAGADAALAARFLYAWPESRMPAGLGARGADDAALRTLLQRIADFAGDPETPGGVPFTPEAVRRLEELMGDLQQRGRAASGMEAEWIGKAVPTIVRLAGLLAMMHWAPTANGDPRVERARLEDAYKLWSEYFLPHAKCVFGFAGTSAGDRLARRTVEWIRHTRPAVISREVVRRQALCQTVDAQIAQDVVARLETGGLVRPVGPHGSEKGGPRILRWEINPNLWGS